MTHIFDIDKFAPAYQILVGAYDKRRCYTLRDFRLIETAIHSRFHVYRVEPDPKAEPGENKPPIMICVRANVGLGEGLERLVECADATYGRPEA